MTLHETPLQPLTALILTERWYPDTYGGSERLAWEQARGLAAQGYSVTVFSSYAAPGLPSVENTPEGIMIVRAGLEMDFPASSMVSILWASRSPLRQLIQNNNYDVVISQHPLIGSVYLQMMKDEQLVVPAFIAIFHSSRPQEMRTEGPRRSYIGKHLWTSMVSADTARRERTVLEAANSIVVFSEFSRRILEEFYPAQLPKVVKIPAGIDSARYDTIAERRTKRQQTDTLQLLTVRRLTPRMGIDVLVKALGFAINKRANVRLRIVGSGHISDALQQRVLELGVSQHVDFLGRISDAQLDTELAAADLFVLPTIALEGFGIATLEAMLSGLPVVGTPVGATPELLEPVHPNLITTDASPHALADRIAWFADLSTSEREELSKRAREYALAHYTHTQMNTALLSVIHAVLGR